MLVVAEDAIHDLPVPVGDWVNSWEIPLPRKWCGYEPTLIVEKAVSTYQDVPTDKSSATCASSKVSQYYQQNGFMRAVCWVFNVDSIQTHYYTYQAHQYQKWFNRLTTSFETRNIPYRTMGSWVDEWADAPLWQNLSWIGQLFCWLMRKSVGMPSLKVIEELEVASQTSSALPWLNYMGISFLYGWAVRQFYQYELNQALNTLVVSLSSHYRWLKQLSAQELVLFTLVEKADTAKFAYREPFRYDLSELLIP